MGLMYVVQKRQNRALLVLLRIARGDDLNGEVNDSINELTETDDRLDQRSADVGWG